MTDSSQLTERMVRDAYDHARNPPPMLGKPKPTTADRQMRFVTELQLAQMGGVIEDHRRRNVLRWRKR